MMKYCIFYGCFLFSIIRLAAQSPITITEPSLRRLVVTHTGVEGPGSLRQAILCANAHLSFDTIVFNVPTSDLNYRNPDGIANNGDEFFNLSLAINDLPTVTDTLIIDALTQNTATCSDKSLLPTFSTQQKGFKPKGLKFVVNGGNLNKQGVQIESSATLLIIRGLVFVNWVNATTKGAGVMKLVPLTGNSKITLDCTYLSNKI